MKAWLSTIVIVAGCGSLSPHPTDPLDDSVRAYNDSVRWGRYEVAANFISPKERAQFVDDADERSKDLRITQYDVVQVERTSARAANVHVKMEWYKLSEGTLHETHAKQTWEQRGRAWLMVQEARVRGHEMPGLPEPPAEPPGPAELPGSPESPSQIPAAATPPSPGSIKHALF